LRGRADKCGPACERGNIVSYETSHIFICFSSKDEAMARDIVEFLEGEQLKCWISSRDVPPGQNYQETIVHAIERARGIVFLFSQNSGESGEIKKELSLAGTFKAPVFPVRLSPVTPSGALRYELATRQWIDIFPDREKALGKLAETIHSVLDPRMAAERDRDPRSPMPANPAGFVASALAPFVEAPAKTRVRKAPRAPIVASGSREFESIRALLARHVGPIAKILIEKTAIKARTPDDLCAQLAVHVKTPSDRAAFLQAARAQLTIKP
jgi:hypothetical protein